VLYWEDGYLCGHQNWGNPSEAGSSRHRKSHDKMLQWNQNDSHGSGSKKSGLILQILYVIYRIF
jgi:hypothetical protein